MSNTGSLSITKPSASTDLIQNIGIVLKTNGSNIQKMKVSAIDRVNDIPNLADGKFFIGGGASGQISNYTLPTSDGSSNQLLQTNGSGAVTFSTPTTDHVSEGGNLYYTEARVSANSSVTTLESGLASEITQRALGDALNQNAINTLNGQFSVLSSDVATNTLKTSFPGFGTTAGTALEGDTALFNGDYASLSNVPSTFAPSSHVHTASEITDFDAEVSNNTDVAANIIKVGYTDAAVDSRIGAASISDLSDVPAIGTAGQVLVVNSGATGLEYANQTGGGASSIDDLTDVDTTTSAPSNGQALVWNSTNSEWEPGTVSGGGGSSQWTTTGGDIYYTTGNVGVGTSTPAQPLHVDGKVKIDGGVIVLDQGVGANDGFLITSNPSNYVSETSHVSVRIGRSAGQQLSAYAQKNVAIGNEALSRSTANFNIAIGFRTAKGMNGGYNVVIGDVAGNQNFSPVTNPRNVILGYESSHQSTVGDNVSIGHSSMRYTTGGQNVVIGKAAGLGDPSTSTFSNTVAVGYQALTALTTGTENTAVGYQASTALTTGSQNTTLGYHAGLSLSTGNKVVAVGYLAGHATTGSNSDAGQTFVGWRAGLNMTSGASGITAIGSNARGKTNGSWMTVVGNNAYSSNTYGTAIGSNAKTGGYGVAVGSSAGDSNAGGTYIGYNAGGNNGSNNTVVGGGAGKGSGSYNVSVGESSGSSMTTGASNVLIGYSSGSALTTESNKLYIENSNSDAPLIYGEFDNDIVRINGDLEVKNSTSGGAIKLMCEAGTHGVTIQSPPHSSAATYTLTLPDTDGNASEFLQTDGSGVLSWSAPSGSGTVTNIATGTGLTGGPITTTGTIALANTAVTAGSYTAANITVDAQGRITAAANGSGGGGGSGGIGTADQTLDADRTIDTNGYNLDIELDPTGTADTFTVHDGTHDLFQVDTSTSGTLFSVNDVSGLPKLEVDETEGVIAKSIKVDDSALTTAGQYGKGAEIWYQGTSTPTAGDVYYLDSSGNWAATDADAVATSKGMLAVAAGADSDVNGMVIKGFVYLATDSGGSVGDPVYLHTTTGKLTNDVSGYSAGDIVRIAGYKVATNVVYFDPSKDWIELS